TVMRELVADDVPGLLWDDQDADAELGHDLHRLRGHGGRIGASLERPARPRSNRLLWLLHERAVVFAVALLEATEDHLRALDEPAARLLHRHAEALELDPSETAADAEDEPAPAHRVEHGDLLRDADRIVPGADDHHRAELHAPRPSRHVGEELEDVRAHRVVGEVVLDAPDRVEAERLGEIG